MTFAIDEKNFFEILGSKTISKLISDFYHRVYNDPDVWFTSIFPPDIDQSIQNLSEFMIQRLHGPSLFTKRKGHPRLPIRHREFRITSKAALRWMKHMRAAMKASSRISGNKEVFAALTEYFEQTSKFLTNAQDDEPSSSSYVERGSDSGNMGSVVVPEGNCPFTASSSGPTDLTTLIEQTKLLVTRALSPTTLDVSGSTCEMGHRLYLIVVSPAFQEVSVLARHRAVNDALQPIRGAIHSIVIRARTPCADFAVLGFGPLEAASLRNCYDDDDWCGGLMMAESR